MATESEDVDVVKRVELDRTVISLRSDNIMHIYMKEGVTLELKDAEAIVETIKEMGNGITFLNLVETGEDADVDREVRAYSASKEANVYTKADAVLVRSFAQRMIGNFYISFNKPIKPTKIFTSKKDAIKWLKQF
jgi:hypothetical protein